jgi:hypothetical protein
VTTNARDVLGDCREARADLVDGIMGSEWRRKWTLVVTLLRTVLHVLDKVDGEGDPAVRVAVSDAWDNLKRTKPNPDIFWQFVDEDRNLIVKLYKHRAGQNASVFLGEPVVVETSYSMNDGPFVGQDPRDVADRAITWLGDYLDAIDEAVSTAERP